MEALTFNSNKAKLSSHTVFMQYQVSSDLHVSLLSFTLLLFLTNRNKLQCTDKQSIALPSCCQFLKQCQDVDVIKISNMSISLEIQI